MKKLKSTDEILDESFWTDEWDGTGDEIANLLTQDRNQAYTRLVEGIEEMKPHVRNVPPSDKQSIEAVCLVQVGYEQCKKDFLENVVKPLYGKLEL